MRFLWIASIWTGILLWGCATERAAGGTAETENAVLARSFLVDSLLSGNSGFGSAPTVAILRMDSLGFDFEGVDPIGRDLEMRGADGRILPFEIMVWDRVARLGRLQVRIDADLMSPGARIELWRGLDKADRSDPEGVWKGLSDSLRLALTSVLVDDFDAANSTTLLPDTSAWYLGTGTGTGIAAAGKGREGGALRLVSTSTGASASALAAALLAPTARSLRSVDSIVFWARGKGVVRVAMEHATGASRMVAWGPIEVDSSWRRVRVLPGTLRSADSDGAQWEDVRDRATHLSFWMAGAGELWIDDPRIFGINRDDLR